MQISKTGSFSVYGKKVNSTLLHTLDNKSEVKLKLSTNYSQGNGNNVLINKHEQLDQFTDSLTCNDTVSHSTCIKVNMKYVCIQNTTAPIFNLRLKFSGH